MENLDPSTYIQLGPDIWGCKDCGTLVGDRDLHDHYCPAKAQTPIGAPIAERNP